VKATLASRDEFTAAKGRHGAEWLHSCSHVAGAVTPGHRSPIEVAAAGHTQHEQVLAFRARASTNAGLEPARRDAPARRLEHNASRERSSTVQSEGTGSPTVRAQSRARARTREIRVAV
jgi:hypothetical protein